MATIYEGKDLRYGFAEQAAFDTAVVDSAAFTEVNLEDIGITQDIRVTEIPGVHATKNEIYRNSVIHTSGSMANFSTSGPFTLDGGDYWLYSHFQKVTEGAASPFTKTYNYFITQPDFSSDEGIFLTWVKRFPEASTSWKVSSCISNSLKLSCERDGFLQYEGGWISKGAVDVTANPSGTWSFEGSAGSSYGMLHFNDIDKVTADFGAGAVNLTLQSFEIQGSYDVEGVSPDGAGGWSNFGLSNRKGTFSLSLLQDTAVETALTNCTTDTPITVVIGWGIAGAAIDRSLQITFTGKIEDISINADGLLGATITGKIVAADASSEPLTIIMSNDTDRTW